MADAEEFKPWFLDEAEQEEFNAIAYSYRSWPATDPKGVADRYDELLRYVAKIIEDSR